MSSERPDRRALSAQETRAAILVAAREAFGERGYAAVSLAEIARNANATTGALYHHFADKKELFTVVADGLEAEIVAHLVANMPVTVDLWELVTYAVVGSLQYVTKPGIARVIFKDAPTVIGAFEWRAIEMRHGFGMMSATLGALAERGELLSEPNLVASIVLGALVQTVDTVLTSQDPERALLVGRDAMLRVVGAFRRSG